MKILFPYFFLIIAVILGTTSNIFAKNALGFTKLLPASLSAITIFLCMFCLSNVMKSLSVGITYASFAGICIIATTLVSFYKFGQLPNFSSIIGLIFIIIGVSMVNLLA